MAIGELGKIFESGQTIVRQGTPGDTKYVVQAGRVEVFVDTPQGETRLSVLEPGDIFGEMALFTTAPRSASVRAMGEARVLTVDKKGFLKRVYEDPSTAFRILKKMSERIQHLNQEVMRLGKSPSQDL